MKYIVGAGIGGLFGLSLPFMINVDEEDVNGLRQEEFQHVDDMPPTPIEGMLTLPDNYCGYIDYDSADPKEQAKECLDRSIIAVPPI